MSNTDKANTVIVGQMCQSLSIVNDTFSIPAGMNNTIQL